jgi:ornithine racemase
MAEIVISRKKLLHNYNFLQKLFAENNLQWGIVTKLLCGIPLYIKEVLNLGCEELLDSRISNLRAIKLINPNVRTIYIKPPPRKSITGLVKYADVSLNTDLETLRLISKEAKKQKKIHQVIIMVEMGELREGVMRDELLDFYAQAFKLPNIEIIGIGTNLNCLYGVMPSTDKLIQLALYKQLIELRFKKKIKLLSGGTSVTIPMMFKKQIPAAINHFRIGETLYFGKNLVTEKTIKGMRDDVITFYAEIIELIEKPMVPEGEMQTNPSGETFSIDPADYGKTTMRALVDVGLLDISPDFLIPDDKNLTIAGASSDMIVIDLHKNPQKYKVGDFIKFKLKYMGALSLFGSNYVIKRIID